LMQAVVDFPPKVAKAGFENFDPEKSFEGK
jgi:hypothetical protein